MPSFMCNNCVMHLSIATSFKEQCLKSDTQLREVLLPLVQSNEKDTSKTNEQETETLKLVGVTF